MNGHNGQRILPLPEDQWTEDARTLLTKGTPDGKPRESLLLRTLAWHPSLYRRWAGFATFLQAGGVLPPRVREIAVLRSVWLANGAYEWALHVESAIGHGVEPVEIEGVICGPDAAIWSSLDRAVLQAVDDLRAEGMVSDAAWTELSAALDEKQLIELVMLIAEYHLVPWLHNSLRIPLPQGNRGLEAR